MPVPIKVRNNSISLNALVNGHPAQFTLDTGDAVGPVFTAADAQRLALTQGPALGVSGAGGQSSVFETIADVTLDGKTFHREIGAIDAALQDESLLGLPFFLHRFDWFMVDFNPWQDVDGNHWDGRLFFA